MISSRRIVLVLDMIVLLSLMVLGLVGRLEELVG